MNDKPHNLAVTKRRVRTFPLLPNRTLFSGIVKPRFLVLTAVAQQRRFLPGVPQVFKKDRSPRSGLNEGVKQQIHRTEFNFSPTISLNFVTSPRSFAESHFEHSLLVNKFTSHFTLLVSQLNNDVNVFKNAFGNYTGKANVERNQSEPRSATAFRYNTDAQRMLVARPSAPGIAAERRPTFQFFTRQSKTISTSPHNWNTHLSSKNATSTHRIVQSNRHVFFIQAVSPGLREHFKTQAFKAILNNSTATNRESLVRNRIHSPTNTFTSIAVQLVLPKVAQTEHVERRIAQFLSRPEMTHLKSQQNSTENIVEVLRDLQKLRSQPSQIPTAQIPSIEQLTSHVRTQLQRELRIERERRGM